MTGEQCFETTSIHLAAALLISVPGATLAHITPAPSIDGKRVLTLRYSLDHAEALQKTVEDFHARRLVVPLYFFNRALNLLRDHLLQKEAGQASAKIPGGRDAD